MKNTHKLLFLLPLCGLALGLISGCASAAPAEDAGVVPIPAIPGVPASAAYSVKVNGQSVPVNDESRFDFQTAAFTMNGAAKVEITLLNGAPAGVAVRPRRYQIAPQINGQTISFDISQPLKLVVQSEGAPNLALIATPTESDVPQDGDPNVVYFGAGTHDAGIIQPQSGQTIYLAPGALVKGRIDAENVKNVTVKGRGVLDTSAYSKRSEKTVGLQFARSSDIKVEGIGVRGGTWWQTLYLDCDDVEVSQMNILGKTVNTDGIDIDGARNFVARDCFIRAEDDGLGWHALDAKANGEISTDGALAENCVIWNSGAGNAIRIGASMESLLFANVTFRDIDILNHAGAAIYSDHSDWALCKNILFENVTDETPEGVAIRIAIAKTRYSNNNGYKDERGRYDGLKFVNFTAPAGAIALYGFDADHQIENVSFVNCRVGANKIDSLSDLKLNEWVKNVTFQ